MMWGLNEFIFTKCLAHIIAYSNCQINDISLCFKITVTNWLYLEYITRCQHNNWTWVRAKSMNMFYILNVLQKRFWETCVWKISSQCLFFFFWPYYVACRILVPWPGSEPVPPALGAQGLNYWTTRKVLQANVLKKAQNFSIYCLCVYQCHCYDE